MALEGNQLGRYRIVRLLGSGGMGEVYLAEDPRIGQQVAIKAIRAEQSLYPNAPGAQEAARHFQREARAIVKLDHPHILPLNDYGESQIGELTLVYLAMPYCPEGSLVRWVQQHYPDRLVPPTVIAHVVSQAAEALQHAHLHQITHQDVKPSNFLIRTNEKTQMLPDVLLADFGFSSLGSATSSNSPAIRGTPTYMAPEQFVGEAVPASDQYALAVMTYELLTGRLPFEGNAVRLMYQHLNATPEPPSNYNPHLSKEMDEVLLIALAKNPNNRFSSVSAFANAFEQASQNAALVKTPTLIVAPAEISSDWASSHRPTQESQNALRFTAFHAKEVAVETWNILLIYTHIESALAAIRTDAVRFKSELGNATREASSQATQPVAHGMKITLVPRCKGITFNPQRSAFIWLEEWHRTEFRFLADPKLAGSAGNGLITVYAGPLIIATLKMPLLFETPQSLTQNQATTTEATMTPYRQVFTSYSHKDKKVVLACRNAYKALGDEVLIDVDSLRSGQAFSPALIRLIETSDIFQLFWSARAAMSPYVRQEWEHALQHSKGEGFIRPVYWEEPIVPPPPPLAHLHFDYQELPELKERRWWWPFR